MENQEIVKRGRKRKIIEIKTDEKQCSGCTKVYNKAEFNRLNKPENPYLSCIKCREIGLKNREKQIASRDEKFRLELEKRIAQFHQRKKQEDEEQKPKAFGQLIKLIVNQTQDFLSTYEKELKNNELQKLHDLQLQINQIDHDGKPEAEHEFQKVKKKLRKT